MSSFEYSDESLLLEIQSLSNEERAFIAKRLNLSDIKTYFEDIKNVIAQEAKRRIQSKIALTFRSSTGALFNSIYYQIEGDSIKVSSTKNYFEILNKGFESFDMKKALSGKTVKMKLPGGKIIYLRVPTSEQINVKKQNKKGVFDVTSKYSASFNALKISY